MADNVERDIGKILQKLEDQDKWLINIDKKLSYTNGRIAENLANISIISERQKNCPALLDHGTPNQRKNLLLGIGMFVIAVLNIYIILKGGK